VANAFICSSAPTLHMSLILSDRFFFFNLRSIFKPALVAIIFKSGFLSPPPACFLLVPRAICYALLTLMCTLDHHALHLGHLPYGGHQDQNVQKVGIRRALP
jgi:hypothetical protein